ncbi:complement C1q-like protein 2 [Megalops cyprinoides]|uniref:complement C1q-like protein 2 n=1 Tax=Megalops cyprinoides TaxID=118141 RepID=UPI00186431D9|nr:complement C1q-like protein 2 [Megalops cyprinoides]
MSFIVLMVLLCCLTQHSTAQAQSREDKEVKVSSTLQDYTREGQSRNDKQMTEFTFGTQPACQPDIYSVLMELRAVEARLKAAESQVTELKALETRLTLAETQVDELRRANRDRPKIAFSASIGGDGDTGPFNVDTTVVYKTVITNIGNAYSPNTGIFTAPVKGVYYFRMSIFARGSVATNAQLLKNGARIVTADSHKTGDPFENSSNGASLLLEVGDQVYTRLWAGRHIFDNANHHSTFSGFLLFPV